MASLWQQSMAGVEFDEWMNWDGEENRPRQQHLRSLQPAKPVPLPTSPASTIQLEPFSTGAVNTPHTAPLLHDLPTPANSSSSPEMLYSHHTRLSGDTLRGDGGSLPSSNSLKRKAPDNDLFEQNFKPVAGRPIGSKRPHNLIEKRYRANLNVKIEMLRDSVPSLRALKKARDRTDNGGSSDDGDDREGLTPNGKLNKASILTKAVDYIKQLEFRTRRLEDENCYLKQQLDSLHKSMSRKGEVVLESAETVNTRSTGSQVSSVSSNNTGQAEAEAAQSPARGLINIPDSSRRMRENQSQEHYGHVYTSSGGGSRFGGKWTQRLALGSLAGLMILEGFTESDQSSDSQRKALFGIPLEILDGWTFLRSPGVYLTTFAQYCRAGGVLPMVKGFLAISILAFLIFAYMFNSKPAPESQKTTPINERPVAATPASPIQVRRRAWSTSMQALGLPHHSFFPEWFAVTSEWINYMFRYWLGPRAALWLCGVASEAETARIKTWDIAIDAQLAGGDHELTRSRAVLTIIGAGTLPKTPLRLMMKAIHCRVVLWNIGAPNSLCSRIATFFASYTANRQWRQARALHEQLSAYHHDRLPGYLNYLLQMDCDEVFSSVVTQRAFNLMYDRPTREYCQNSLLDVVVEDHAIRSPLDAVAAWRSTSALEEALLAAVETPDAADLLREHIQVALEIAPPGSAAETRALAVHAVLSPARRHTFYVKAVDAVSIGCTVETYRTTEEAVPYFIDSSTPTSARPEIAACLACAAVMLKLEHEQDLSDAVDMFCRLAWVGSDSRAVEPTLLFVAPLYFTMSRLLKRIDTITSLRDQYLGTIGSSAAVWYLRRSTLSTHGYYHERAHAALTRAVGPTFEARLVNCESYSSTASRRYSNASHDTGYASQEDDASGCKSVL